MMTSKMQKWYNALYNFDFGVSQIPVIVVGKYTMINEPLHYFLVENGKKSKF